jgi:flagellar basal-body rod protein FlgB
MAEFSDLVLPKKGRIRRKSVERMGECGIRLGIYTSLTMRWAEFAELTKRESCGRRPRSEGMRWAMAIGDLPLLSGLKTSMRWHQARQKVLAENVANADTPGFRGKDLKSLTFSSPGTIAEPSGPTMALDVTHPGHIQGRVSAAEFSQAKNEGFEVRPNGNAVNLEDEMIKSGENQIDFQTVASLYQRSLGVIRKAAGKS